MTTKVLLFEKGGPPAGSLASSLEEEGYAVLLAHEEEKVIEWASSGEPDLLIVDISGLALDGLWVCKSLQKEMERLPCLLIVAEGEEVEVEADAQLAKPLTPEHLSNRIEELLQLWGEKFLQVGNLTLNLETRRVFREDEAHKLTPKQFDLLKTFMHHPREVLSRKFLMREVWDTDYLGDVGTLYVHVRWLREKIEEDPNSPLYLRTVRGKGYRFDVPEEET